MADRDKVLAIDSTWDDNTNAASTYRATFLYDYMASCGYPVDLQAGSNANASQVQQEIAVSPISYITGVSHGSDVAFTGDDNQPVFEIGAYDPDMVRGKIIHFLACNTAHYLGRNMVQASRAAAFFGYSGMFSWPDAGGQQYADIFFACDAQIDRALVEGKTALEAAKIALQSFSDQIAALQANGDDASLRAAAMLEKNRDMLCGPQTGPEYGAQDARLPSGH
jgi:hypothetical protein